MASSDESDDDFVPGQAENNGSDDEDGTSRRQGGSDGGSSDEGEVRVGGGTGGDYGGGSGEDDDDDDDDDDFEGGGGSDDEDGDDDEEGSVPIEKNKGKSSSSSRGKGKKKDRSSSSGGGKHKDKKKKKKKTKRRSKADGDDDGGGGGSSSKRKRGGGSAAAMFDDEAEESDGGGGGSEDDDEDDEDNEYRLDGFVVGDEDDEEDASDGGKRRRQKSGSDNKRKRLRKAREDDGMLAADDEDLELIREAQGASAGQTRESDRNEQLVAEDGQDLGNLLFDGEEEEVARRQEERQQQRQRQRQEHDDFDSEDDGDFIVDDLGTERRQGRRQQQESFQGGASGPSQDQVYEAMEIFGEGIQDFDFMKEPEDDSAERAAQDARKQALAGIEPSLLKEKFLTDQDKMIQETDRPERLQLRMPSRGEASDAERRDEAQWICNQLDLGYGADETRAREAVEHVLRFLGVESQEVPFVWHYRKDYLWTGPGTFLGLEHLWKIHELDETWDKVGNRRDKVAKASKALWDLMDGDENSDDERESGYSSETPDDRDVRLAEEEAAKETRDTRLRRSQEALQRSEAALTKAEEEAAKGPERVNNDRLGAAQAAKKEKKAAAARRAEAEDEMRDDGEEDEEVGDGDWERATEESLAKALKDAKASVSHATSYLIGMKGELAVEEAEEEGRNMAREARRQERKEAAARERQRRRDEARSAMEEEAALFPSEQYSYLINSQEEVELKDMQDYLALVSLMGETDAKVRNATGNSMSDKRRPRRAGRADDNLYRAARQAGLRGLANKFSITAAQLGEAITGITQQYYPVPTPGDAVELVASDMKGAEDTPLFSSGESILKGVRHILAREIAAEPRVKAKCRAMYRRFARVSTSPTDKGKAEIDAFHPLYGLQYLTRKQVTEFMTGPDRTQWLQMEKGKAEGLLTYVIHPPDKRVESYDEKGKPVTSFELDKTTFLELLNPTYNPTGVSSGPIEQGWDHQRNLVLHEALVEHLIPAFETEVVFELKAAARAAVVEEASGALARRLAVGPFEREDLTTFQKIVKGDSKLKHDQARVVAIYVSSDSREDSWAAAIDPSGSVLDHLQIPHNRDARAKKLKAFIKSNRPHVVGVSTSAGQSSRYMMDALANRRSGQNGEPQSGIVADAHREYQQERDDYDDQDEEEEEDTTWKQCTIAPVKDDVASIFARSTRGEKEFADFSVNQRAAVALARYLQDPLVEFAGMWTTMDSSGNFGHETFSLRLHPLQDQVPPQQLLKVWTHRMMDAVSAVGVDINHAAEHEHAKGVLQFVPGLGPRKAAKLRERLGTVLGGVVPSRKALLSSQLLKSLVYTNAAGFLRIRERGKLAEELEGQVDPFDDTRVHPECYNTQDWAQRICANALDVQVDDDYFPIVESAMDDSREALQRLCQTESQIVYPRHPPTQLNDSVNQLDLSAYADELEKQGEGKRALQLDTIVEEIRYPYRDRRMPYTKPGEDELFEWLTGETDATLREGVLVPVRVMRHNDAGVKVRLEGGPGLFGFVPKDYVTDDVLPVDPITGQNADLRAVVKENQLMEAAIIKVDKGRFELKLSLRKSDTQPDPDKWDAPNGAARVFGASGWNRPHTLRRLDETFDVERAKSEAREQIKDQLKKANDRARRRGGSSSGRAGVRFPRSIMHPQFKNFTHLEAEEYLKETSDTRGEALIRPSSKGSDHLSLTWMWVEGEFMHTDIKELGKQPGSMLAPRLKIGGEEYEDLDEIISRRVSACNDLVNDLLASDKYNAGTTDEVEKELQNQKQAAPNRIPYLICRRGVPGYVNLMYLPANSVRKIVVEVSPEGYVMSKRTFKTLPELLKWFKLNAQQLGRSSRTGRKASSRHSSSSNGNSAQQYNQHNQPPLPPENPGNVPPPPPPRPAAPGQQQQQQQYPAYAGGAYGYNSGQPQQGYAPQAGYSAAAPPPPPPSGGGRAGSRWGQAPAAAPAPLDASPASPGSAYQAQYAPQPQQQQQQQWYDQQQQHQQQQQLYQQQFVPQARGARDSSQARK